MYATCIGLILKGYNVYENSIEKEKYKTAVPKEQEKEDEATRSKKSKPKEKGIGTDKTRKRTKSLKEFMDSIKGGLIELFKEEGDEQLR